MKLNLNFEQRDNLIDGLSTFVKPTIITESEIKPVIVQDFSKTLKVIENLDDLTISKKFNLMTNNQIVKTVSEAGQIFIQEVKEGKTDLNSCFEKFTTVWFAIPNKTENLNIYLETLREFKYTLAEQLPEYAVENEGKKDLQNKIATQLAKELVKHDACSPGLRQVVIMAMTDFDLLIDKKFKKPDLNKNETTTTKLKNN